MCLKKEEEKVATINPLFRPKCLSYLMFGFIIPMPWLNWYLNSGNLPATTVP